MASRRPWTESGHDERDDDERGWRRPERRPRRRHGRERASNPRPKPLATAGAGAATTAALGAHANFGHRYPETMNVQGPRGEFLMGGAGLAGLTLLGQVAPHLSPTATHAGGHDGAAAPAGLGDATG